MQSKGNDSPEGHEEQSEMFIFIDGSNVAYGTGDKSPKLQRINAVLSELEKYAFHIVPIVDARLRHTIDDSGGLQALFDNGTVHQVPARTRADDFLMQLANRKQNEGFSAYILTNDKFPLMDQGTIPRITFMAIDFGGIEEWTFIPPLESLIEPPEESTSIPDFEEGEEAYLEEVDEPYVIDSALMESFIGLIATRNPSFKAGDEIAFAQVAGYLHNQWDGDFCKKFNYSRPKNFATMLEMNGYVELVTKKGPLYLVINDKLLDRCGEFLKTEDDIEVEMEETATLGEDDMQLLSEAFEDLREENHFPTEPLIAIKLRAHGMDRNVVASLLESAEKDGTCNKEVGQYITSYWPVEGRWEATDPNNPDDPYHEDLWMEFRRSINSLPANERIAQTRYFLAKNLKEVGTSEFAALPQAVLEHMVQLAVRKGILIRIDTLFGKRISVPVED